MPARLVSVLVLLLLTAYTTGEAVQFDELQNDPVRSSDGGTQSLHSDIGTLQKKKEELEKKLVEAKSESKGLKLQAGHLGRHHSLCSVECESL